MEDRKIPPEVQNFGQARYEDGFNNGYTRSEWDARKRKSHKETIIRKQFNLFLGYLDDIISLRHKH